MANVSTLLPLIRTHVQFCPDIAIEAAINKAVREFCDETYYLERTIEVDMEEGSSHYDLVVTDYPEEEVIAVKNVEHDGRPLSGYNSEMVDDSTGYPPTGYIFWPPNTIEVVPYPNEAPTLPLIVEVATKPILNSQEVPDEIIRKYQRCIAYGAISWLTSMPNEAWSNIKLSTYFDRLFRYDMVTAKSEVMFGHVPRNVIITNPRFLI